MIIIHVSEVLSVVLPGLWPWHVWSWSWVHPRFSVYFGLSLIVFMFDSLLSNPFPGGFAFNRVAFINLSALKKY